MLLRLEIENRRAPSFFFGHCLPPQPPASELFYYFRGDKKTMRGAKIKLPNRDINNFQFFSSIVLIRSRPSPRIIEEALSSSGPSSNCFSSIRAPQIYQKPIAPPFDSIVLFERSNGAGRCFFSIRHHPQSGFFFP